MNYEQYEKVICRLGLNKYNELVEKAKSLGITPKEYIENREELIKTQYLVANARWIDLRSPVYEIGDGYSKRIF